MRTDIRHRDVRLSQSSGQTSLLSSSTSSSPSIHEPHYLLRTSTIITVIVTALLTAILIGLIYVTPCQLSTSHAHHIQTKYDALLIQYVKLQAHAGGSQVETQSFAPLVSQKCPPCPVASVVDTSGALANVKGAMSKGGGVSFNSLGENVLELQSHINLKDHEKQWLYCAADTPDHKRILRFCQNTPTNEQNYQLKFYDQKNRKTGEMLPFRRPSYTTCIQTIPTGYKFPSKTLSLPSQVAGVHWPNLRVQSLQQLKIFNPTSDKNPTYHKNLYHFDAPKYDIEFEKHIEFGARYIPLGPKIRLALDCGSGGGSFGLWLRYKYNIQSLSIAFPDWPYCEYISERGNLCMYLDGYHAFPFAKFTFDLVHVSWIYHSLEPEHLETVFLELFRITRPGGYLWMSDGWSKAQVAVIDRMIQILGLVILYDHRDQHPGEKFFGNQPYQVQLWQMLLKPISAAEAPDCGKPSRVVPKQPTPTVEVYPPEDKQHNGAQPGQEGGGGEEAPTRKT